MSIKESYLQCTLFGTDEEVVVNDKPTVEEINEYYKTHTSMETAKHFNIRNRSVLKIVDPTSKPNTHNTKRLKMEAELNIMFLKRIFKFSNRAIGRYVGCSENAVRYVLRRNEDLKNLFDEYMMKAANMYGERFLDSMPFLMDGMEKLLVEAFSRKKITGATGKELIDSWDKIHTNITKNCRHEEAESEVETEARERLLAALEDGINSNDMDRKEMEGPYYQADLEEKEGQEEKE